MATLSFRYCHSERICRAPYRADGRTVWRSNASWSAPPTVPRCPRPGRSARESAGRDPQPQMLGIGSEQTGVMAEVRAAMGTHGVRNGIHGEAATEPRGRHAARLKWCRGTRQEGLDRHPRKAASVASNVEAQCCAPCAIHLPWNACEPIRSGRGIRVSL